MECLEKVDLLKPTNYNLATWVEILLKGETSDNKSFPDIYELVRTKSVEVLKVTSEHEQTIEGLEQKIKEAKSVKELSPEEVFEQKYLDAGLQKEELTDVIDAYHEILSQIREGREE